MRLFWLRMSFNQLFSIRILSELELVKLNWISGSGDPLRGSCTRSRTPIVTRLRSSPTQTWVLKKQLETWEQQQRVARVSYRMGRGSTSQILSMSDKRALRRRETTQCCWRQFAPLKRLLRLKLRRMKLWGGFGNWLARQSLNLRSKIHLSTIYSRSMKPSKYQLKILDWLKNGHGNAICGWCCWFLFFWYRNP